LRYVSPIAFHRQRTSAKRVTRFCWLPEMVSCSSWATPSGPSPRTRWKSPTEIERASPT